MSASTPHPDINPKMIAMHAGFGSRNYLIVDGAHHIVSEKEPSVGGDFFIFPDSVVRNRPTDVHVVLSHLCNKVDSCLVDPEPFLE
ncbi:hypothetical protein [Caballeronia sp. KNU42]